MKDTDYHMCPVFNGLVMIKTCKTNKIMGTGSQSGSFTIGSTVTSYAKLSRAVHCRKCKIVDNLTDKDVVQCDAVHAEYSVQFELPKPTTEPASGDDIEFA